MLTWPNGDGSDIQVQDIGDAFLIIDKGVKTERNFFKLGKYLD